MQARVLAAAAVVLALAGCRATEWPSDADPAAFCDVVTDLPVTEHGDVGALERLGTPEDLPFEARRYLLALDKGEDPEPADEQALGQYIADHC